LPSPPLPGVSWPPGRSAPNHLWRSTHAIPAHATFPPRWVGVRVLWEPKKVPGGGGGYPRQPPLGLEGGVRTPSPLSLRCRKTLVGVFARNTVEERRAVTPKHEAPPLCACLSPNGPTEHPWALPYPLARAFLNSEVPSKGRGSNTAAGCSFPTGCPLPTLSFPSQQDPPCPFVLLPLPTGEGGTIFGRLSNPWVFLGRRRPDKGPPPLPPLPPPPTLSPRDRVHVSGATPLTQTPRATAFGTQGLLFFFRAVH